MALERRIFELQFDSDVDKATYILAQSKKSLHDADYLEWAKKTTGKTESELREMGTTVRGRIKALAKDSEPGTLRDT